MQLSFLNPYIFISSMCSIGSEDLGQQKLNEYTERKEIVATGGKGNESLSSLVITPFYFLLVHLLGSLFLFYVYNKPQDIEQIKCKDQKLGEKRVT